MTHDVFISYSSKDKPIADGICANLEAAGVRCWIAPRDIAPGEEWPRAITNAISNSQVMILVFSSASNSSSDVGREIVLAANHNLVIIPFKIENIEPEPGKQYYLAQTHWLEAMNPPTKDQVQKLVERVKLIVPPLDSIAAGQTTPIPVAVNEQPIKTSPVSKRSPLRPAYGWMVGALVLIILGIFLWPKMQGMVPKPEATPSQTATGSLQSIPTVTPTVIETKMVPTPTAMLHFSLLQTLKDHTDEVLSLAFSPDGSILASTSKDYTLILWDTTNWTAVKTLAVFTNQVNCVAFSPDGNTMVSGSGAGVMLWDTANWTNKKTLTDHSGAVVSLAFSTDGRRLASGSNDSTIILWDTASYTKYMTINDHTSFVWSLAFSPDGGSLASVGYQDDTIKINDTSSGILLQTLLGGPGDVSSVTFSPDGQTLTSASRDGLIILWDTSNWTKLRGFTFGNYAAFSPDGRTLASGFWNGHVDLWEVASGKQLQTMTGNSHEIKSLTFSPDGRTLASGSADGTIKIWKLD
jgi:WD40 repeat protein